MVDIGGRELHIDVRGRGNPTVVLEAGIAASSISWSLVQNRIAEFTTAVSYDRAGFGWSSAAPHRATALAAAEELSLLLDRAELTPPFILVGHSFGGLIARIFQQTFPEKVAGLVLVDPISRTEWTRASPHRKKMLARGVALSRRGAFLARIGLIRPVLRLLLAGSHVIPKLASRAFAGEGASVTERLPGEVRKLPREVWPAMAAHWSEARCFEAMAQALEKIPVSVRQVQEGRSLGDLSVVVISAGSTDEIVKREHENEARLSTRGEHIVLPGAGHWIQLDDPEAVIEAVRRVFRASGS